MCLNSKAATAESNKAVEIVSSLTTSYSPSDYHMFVSGNEPLYGRRFAIDDEVYNAAHMWLQSQLKKTFFADGIRRLVNCHRRCTGKRGNYDEK